MILVRVHDSRPLIADWLEQNVPDLDQAHRDAILHIIGAAERPLPSARLFDFVNGAAWGIICFLALTVILAVIP